MSKGIPNLEDLAKTLVENGAVYVAANEQSLVDEPAQLYYHLPVGVSDEQKKAIGEYLKEVVGDQPQERQLGVVRIDGQQMPVAVRHILRGELHLYRRVPVYVSGGVAGLNLVKIGDGASRVRDLVAGKTEVSPKPAETVSLETLVRDLADAGAASVEMETEFLVRDEPQIELRIPMVPADGKPIVGPVKSVEVAGETYPLNATFTLDGPYGSVLSWEALYISDDVLGAKPVSVEEGVKHARNLFDRAEDADSLRDLESNRPSVERDDSTAGE